MKTDFWTTGATVKPSLFAGAMLVLAASTANATVLFSSSLQAGASLVSQWNAPGYSGSAVIATAPGGEMALTFGSPAAGGDLFTRGSFTSATGTFGLTFDYLGNCGQSSQCGAFVGANGGSPNNGGWILSDTPYADIPNNLPDTGGWEQVSYVFSGVTTDLFLEDFVGSAYSGSDVIYFKNFLLTDNPSGLPVGTLSYTAMSGVPEPGSWALILVGFCGLGATVRRRRQLSASCA